jgi:hypothetical protein
VDTARSLVRGKPGVAAARAGRGAGERLQARVAEARGDGRRGRRGDSSAGERGRRRWEEEEDGGGSVGHGPR